MHANPSDDSVHPEPLAAIEWPTLAMMVATYGLWLVGTAAWQISAPLSLLVTTLMITQFSSLQHEVLHGHPFANRRLNEALVFPALTLIVPFNRFRDLHLAHHFDPNLTDPYDDPEANYMDPHVWDKMSAPVKALYRMNNTLMGRILFGPAIAIYGLVKMDAALIAKGDLAVLWAWVLNTLGVALVLIWVLGFTAMPVWAYCVAAYAGFGLLKIRTYLEHRAHEQFRARTVVVEDKGLLALLFLNNNFHVVHHMHPGAAWYKLPGIYAAKRDYYLRRNDSYVYRSYAQIFRLFLFRAKDPVPHPLWAAPIVATDQPGIRSSGET